MTKINRHILKALFLGCLMLLGLSACEKLVEVKPTNVLTISTYNDVKALLGSHLKTFSGGGRRYLNSHGILPFYTTSKEYLYAHLYSDDYDVNQYQNWMTQNNLSDFRPSLEWRHLDAPGELWDLYYRNIGFYNMILSELNKYPSDQAVENEQVAAEAKILRAWYFFRLMQYFMPYHEMDLGLPLNTDPDAVGSYDGRRKSQQENYDFLISELNEVLSYSGVTRREYNIFYNPRIAHALLAQIYLHKGGSAAGSTEDYDNAIKHAQILLDGGLDYRVMRPVLPTSADSPEIFGIYTDKPYVAVVAIQSSYELENYVWGSNWYGVPQFPSESLYNLFSDNDKRKERNFSSFDHSVTRYEATFLYTYSLYEFFTGAEMKLILAESYARKGDDASALTELTEFANTRYTNYVRPADETVLQSILNERRREFCFDFTMRWLDLTRLQTGFSHVFKRVDAGEDEVFTLEDNDPRFCFPIPNKEELIENPIPQNPGWTNFN